MREVFKDTQKYLAIRTKIAGSTFMFVYRKSDFRCIGHALVGLDTIINK